MIVDGPIPPDHVSTRGPFHARDPFDAGASSAKASGRLGSPLAVAVVYFAMLAVIVGNWTSALDKLDLYRAWVGYTPFAYVDIVSCPEHYAKDFMSGFNLMKNSALMRYFDVSYRWLGIHPAVNVPVFIACEYLSLALAMLVLVKSLRPKASPAVAALAVMLVIGSDAVNMDFARYHWAFVAGFQNIPHALRILAIALLLQRRPIPAGILLGAAFASHVTMGLVGAVFALAVCLSDRRNWTDWRYYAGGSLFLLMAGGWILFGMDTKTLARHDFPPALWISITKLLSSHLYPWQMGLFTQRHWEGITPFLSLALLLVYYLPAPGKWTQQDRGALHGVVAMMLLVTAGVAFSMLEFSPFLIKLSLHRANDLVILIALVYIIDGLWKEIGQGGVWRSCGALSILVSPFLMRPGFPLLWSAAIALPGWLPSKPENRQWARRALLGALSVVSLALLFVYWGAGWEVWGAFVGGRRFLAAAISASGIVLLSQLPLGHRMPLSLRHGAAFAVLLAASFYWIWEHVPSENQRAEPLDYRAAQIWAEENTDADSLFMVDPTILYGWRDYARRSSFGNYREWLFTGIFYTSNRDLFEEGLQRAEALGVDLRDYLGVDDNEGVLRLHDQFIKGFYNRSDAWRLDLASRYGIDYFVMMKGRMVQPSHLPVVYQNGHFAILSVKPETAQGPSSQPAFDRCAVNGERAVATPPLTASGQKSR